MSRLALVLLSIAATAGSQQVRTASTPVLFDFEDGLTGWHASNGHFDGQPYCAKTIANDFAPSSLQGDYWRDLTVPLGQHGNCLLATIRKSPANPTGILVSDEFLLDAMTPFLSFRIGGTADLDNERVELEVRIPADHEQDFAAELRDWWARTPGFALPHGLPPRDGAYWIVGAATGPDTEPLRQDVFELPNFLRGLQARFRVVDGPVPGHINLDYLRLTKEAPEPVRVPVFGFADYHTHPMSYLAFGGMKNIHTLWGRPGGNVEDYLDSDPYAISRDIPHCVRGHYGGYFAEAFINGSQLEHYDFPSVLHAILFPHKRSGGPEFENFPDHLMGAHEQMHVTMIRRAYDGGLRLMVALATDNQAAQFLVGVVQNGHMDIVPEKASLEAQIEGMKCLVDLNHKWMQIAHSPAEAREIILHNKLAIILGVEMDHLGELHLGSDDDEPRLEADYLWNMGVRAVTPIHAINNKIGGPAVFIEPYNWLNDLAHRADPDASSWDTSRSIPDYFRIREDRTCAPNPAAQRGECVLRRLDPGLEFRAAIGRPLFNLFRRSPVIFWGGYNHDYDTRYGHKNTVGLEGFGRDYIGALMDHGLIVDIAHMSDKSVDDTYKEAEKRAIATPGTIAAGALPQYRNVYPLIISHAHMRAQAVYDDLTVPDYLPSEYDISDQHLAAESKVGGVIGAFIEEPRIDRAFKGNPKFRFLPNCGGSSINFAYSFGYAARSVNTPEDEARLASRVGLATDMTFISMVSPRFGNDACDGYRIATGRRIRVTILTDTNALPAHPKRSRSGTSEKPRPHRRPRKFRSNHTG